MRVADLCTVMETIAPRRLAAEWDNVGLLIGRTTDPLRRVLLCIDATDAVIAEGRRLRVDTLLAYHPPIFAPLKTLGDGNPATGRALQLARSGLAVYSPHTALDSAQGGMSEFLAAQVGPGWIRPIERAATLGPSLRFKLLTMCPVDAAPAIRAALARAGAGVIGQYDLCAFETLGTGHFRGGAGANPTVGRAGKLESVAEAQISVVVSERNLPAALAALRGAHPYEEPPIEVFEQAPRPSATEGQGRIVELDKPQSAATLARTLKRALRVRNIQVAEPASRAHRIVAVCPGSGASLVAAAAAQGATAFVTGEMKHHDVLDALAQGVTVILAGHTETERCYLPTLMKRLRRALGGVRFTVSRADRAPLLAE